MGEADDFQANAATFREQIKTLFGAIDDLKDELKDITKDMRGLMAGRPSWSVAILITLLTSGCVGEGVALLTLHK